eukprot:9038785-Pyramimonas_sp.AAC.1
MGSGCLPGGTWVVDVNAATHARTLEKARDAHLVHSTSHLLAVASPISDDETELQAAGFADDLAGQPLALAFKHKWPHGKELPRIR